jgi:1,4-alpha-glucan branching enzyme
MSLRKRYLKTKPVGKVTFRLSAAAADGSDVAYLVGEFNGWDPGATPMQRLKSGAFTVTVDLAPGQEYAFRYLLADGRWANDTEADAYQPSGFPDAENSVVAV